MESNLSKIRPLGFAPMLYLKDVAAGVEFYKKAFGAIVLRSIDHAGKMHVAEMAVGTALLRMHEEVSRDKNLSPSTLGGTSVVIGLLVKDPHAVMAKAVAAGGREIGPIQDYDYGYRQGTLEDPFGHHWLLEMDVMI